MNVYLIYEILGIDETLVGVYEPKSEAYEAVFKNYIPHNGSYLISYLYPVEKYPSVG